MYWIISKFPEIFRKKIRKDWNKFRKFPDSQPYVSAITSYLTYLLVTSVLSGVEPIFLGGGAKFYPSQGGGRIFGPEEPRVGRGFLGRGTHQLWGLRLHSWWGGGFDSGDLPQRSPGQSLRKFGIWCNLRHQKSLQRLMFYNVQVIPGTTC